MQKKTTLLNLAFLAILLALVCLSALYFYPFAMEIPHRDSGIYLYVGSEVLKGKTIYVDVWEHKPPFIFWVNALGLLLGGGSPWGIWGLEVAFLCAAVAVSYTTLRKQLNPILSLLLTVAVYLSTYLTMSGNFTEEYALLFQALIILVFLNHYACIKKLPYFWVGALSGVVFNIKQTYIDVTAGIVILLFLIMLFTRQWKRFTQLVWMGMGFLAVNLLVFVIMAAQGAVRDWWETAYLFNFAYSDLTIFERLEAFQDMLLTLVKNPFIVLMAVIWLLGVLLLLFKNFHSILQFFTTRAGRWILLSLALFFLGLLIAAQFLSTNPRLGVLERTVLGLMIICLLLFLLSFPRVHQLLFCLKAPTVLAPDQKLYLLPLPYTLGLVTLPIVLLLVGTSGRNYNHYFITFYPSMFLLFFGVILLVQQAVKKPILQKGFMAILLLGFLLGVIQPVKKIANALGGPYFFNPYRNVVAYVQANSTEDDTLMVWAMDTVVNYLAERSAPSRFNYVDPAYYDSPLQLEAQQTLYHDITTHRPKFILDMRNPDYPFINGRTQAQCLTDHPTDGTDLDRLIRFACENYEYINRIDNIEVYKYAGN